VTFTPVDTNLPAAQASVQLAVTKAEPIITLPAPTSIAYGTALSAAQLNATASVREPLSTTLPQAQCCGGNAYSVCNFHSSRRRGLQHNAGFSAACCDQGNAHRDLDGSKAVSYGTALSATQLNARALVRGTFVYTPDICTVLPAGKHMLSVTLLPMESADFATAQATVPLVIEELPNIASLMPASADQAANRTELTPPEPPEMKGGSAPPAPVKPSELETRSYKGATYVKETMANGTSRRIEAEQPATLPADFSEWDSGEHAAVQASSVNGFDAALRAARFPGRTQRRTFRGAGDKPAGECFYDPSENGQRGGQGAFQAGSVRGRESRRSEGQESGQGQAQGEDDALRCWVVLLIPIALGYFKLRSGADTARQPVVLKPAPENPPPAMAMNLPAAPELPKPAAGNAQAPMVTPPDEEPQQVALGAQSEAMSEQLTAPSRIPSELRGAAEKGTPPSAGFGAAGVENLGASGGSVFGRPAVSGGKVVVLEKVRLSAGVAGGLLRKRPRRFIRPLPRPRTSKARW